MGQTTCCKCCNIDYLSQITSYETNSTMVEPKTLNTTSKITPVNHDKEWKLGEEFKVPIEILSKTEKGLQLVIT